MMATAAEDLTKCGICKESVNDPKALPCLHTFCLVCLREWTEHDTTSSKSVICPACKKTMPLPDDGVDGLPGNYFVSTLMERSQVLKPVNVACVCCEEIGSKLLARCLTCDGFLCDKGIETHQRMKFLQSHQVINLEFLRSGKVNLKSVLNKKPTCSKHDGQALWFFCETCGVLVCRDCTVVNHKSPEHAFVELDCAIKEQKREIQQLVEKSDTVANQINDALHATRSTRRSLEFNAKQALLDIEKSEEETIKQIRKIFQDEKDILREYATDAHTKITAVEEIFVSQQEQLKRAQEMATQVLETGSDYDVASVYKQLKSSLQDVCRVRPSSLDSGLDNITYKADDILPLTNQHPGTLILGPNISSCNWVLIKEFGQEGLAKIGYPTDVAITPSGDIVVARQDASTPVHVYNRDGKFKFSFNKKSSNARNIVSSSDGKFLVTTETSKHVTVYCPKGQYLSEFPAVSPEGVKSSSGKASLYGLAINTQNQLMVGETASEYISIHDINGSHITSFKVPICPRYIASTKQNNIVISARGLGSVHVIDITGTPLATIDGVPDVNMWCPRGVCVSLKDEICIANDGDQCLHCFSVDGTYLRCIYKGLQRPQGITLMDMDKKLVIAECWPGTVKILTRV